MLFNNNQLIGGQLTEILSKLCMQVGVSLLIPVLLHILGHHRGNCLIVAAVDKFVNNSFLGVQNLAVGCAANCADSQHHNHCNQH